MLIIGIGNRYRSDDAVGLMVAQRLRALVSDQIRVLETESADTGLLDVWKDAETVILIDAMQSGAEPGTVYRFEAHTQPIPAHFFHCSTHTLGVAEAIALGRVLGQLPPYCIVYGIAGKEFSRGEGLSLAVEKAAEDVVQRVLRELQENRHRTPS
jgi:hydrogenase maturation protease